MIPCDQFFKKIVQNCYSLLLFDIFEIENSYN